MTSHILILIDFTQGRTVSCTDSFQSFFKSLNFNNSGIRRDTKKWKTAIFLVLKGLSGRTIKILSHWQFKHVKAKTWQGYDCNNCPELHFEAETTPKA